jgi:hypothetical protein
MRDPHVMSLRYRLETDLTLSFENCAPLQHEATSLYPAPCR